ncbi:hypothetical protein UA08_05238 [Talaromyces atroroseus]|uniref:HNH nuclease domain-containing protein n=1 Tax=Talaromyces atroroseus TaxID=1441469 RepID=A0A225AGD5_TALAT|nr:hypothetical protein UA08_05238 [Talaromyces atroroseus]OKL59740.1 hypothetical protein UA08_05238 [Talaromyces atroroseus]
MASLEPGPSVPTASAHPPGTAPADLTSGAISATVEEKFYDPQRLDLLNRLVQLIGLTSFPSAWACLWLSDIERFETLIHAVTADPASGHTTLRGHLETNNLITLLPTWLSKTRNVQQSNASTSIPTISGSNVAIPSTLKRKLDELEMSGGSRKRSAQAVTTCNERDGNACVLTKDGTHDVAHIYPFSLHNSRPDDTFRTSFWALLGTFWSERRLQSWKQAVFPNGGYDELCYNMISLSPSAHRYYGKAYFVLKPISLSDDQKRFVVQFFWLSCGDFRGNPRSLVILETRPPLGVMGSVGPARSRLWNHETGEPIRSGDMITLETHDPISHPLPEWEIMEMQWFLHRAAAISAAADVNDDYYDDDGNVIGALAKDLAEMEDDDYVTEFGSTYSEPESHSSDPSSVSTGLHKATAGARSSLDTVTESSMDVEGQ